MSQNTPTEINLNRKTRTLTVFAGGESFEMSCEYLRVHSPSAEVQGHGPGQGVLQVGKERVNIDQEPIGNYAIKPVFDDGHTGIYSWDTLYTLGRNQAENWSYLAQLKDAGHQRKMDS